ncbi:hypothetical protein EDM59_01650 [Brevibacillus nitrificans]|uniref:Phage ABA sandwich domain-containing protein n=1 Tax=Brevibacillus nitrificans TaxID=651560 RepID=A0A3M8DRR2_9BACL|nr:hypothetical protein [Brevibacillus nitrificans]RNB90179.1 hypothetical protein EDM59_01650 [Brevibacillus nitrificans]
MTEQQIVLTLATKIMGWKRYGETDFWYGDNGNLFDSSLWNPLQNIADAWMIMEKIKDTDIGDDFDDIMDHFNLTQITPEKIGRTVYCLTQR